MNKFYDNKNEHYTNFCRDLRESFPKQDELNFEEEPTCSYRNFVVVEQQHKKQQEYLIPPTTCSLSYKNEKVIK